jgi:hypothetical protein
MGKKGGCAAVYLVGALALLPGGAQAQWRSQFEAAFVHDSNLSRAQVAPDKVRDMALIAGARLARIYAVGDDADLSVGADARLTRYNKSHGASFASLGAIAGWRRKLGLGLTAPWIALDGSAALEDAREDIRDGMRYVLSAAAGKRFTRELEASAGVAYDRRVQREGYEEEEPGYGGKPFSIQGRSLFARANYALGERATLIGAAALREGDVVSSTRRNFAIFGASNAIADDPAFGPDFIAYRLSGARTRTLTGGLSWQLGPRSTLDATLTRDDTRVGGGLDYDAVIFALTFVVRR